MNILRTTAVSKVVCSQDNWMIEVGQRCKNAREIQLVGLQLDVGGSAFLNRLAANESLEIIQTHDGITLRRS